MILAEDTAKYSGIFQYDPLGWIADMGYGPGFETAWAANVFTAPAKTSIAAAGFYAVSANCSYEVRVYTGATGTNPRAGTLRATTTGTSVFAGYTTVPLPSPVAVAAGQKFSVVVKFTTPGYNYPVATEIRSSGYSDGAVAHTGESLLSFNGTTWTDFMLNASYVSRQINFCIKAYTAPVPAIAVTDPAAGARWMRGTTQTINWTKSGTQADTVKIQLFRDTTKVSDITLSTENDGTFDWAIPANLTARTGYTIRVTTTDGKVKGTSAKFTIAKPIADGHGAGRVRDLDAGDDPGDPLDQERAAERPGPDPAHPVRRPRNGDQPLDGEQRDLRLGHPDRHPQGRRIQGQGQDDRQPGQGRQRALHPEVRPVGEAAPSDQRNAASASVGTAPSRRTRGDRR